MYEVLSDFLRSTAAGNPFVWAFFVMAVVAGTGLLLFLFWERLFRLLLPSPRPGGSRPDQRD